MTNAEKKFQSRLREIGCIVCRLYLGVHTHPSIHHMRPMGKQNVDEVNDVLPLCYHHHQGAIGFHSERSLFESEFGTQEELRCELNAILEG